jgi:hypothetical protein
LTPQIHLFALLTSNPHPDIHIYKDPEEENTTKLHHRVLSRRMMLDSRNPKNLRERD